MLCMYVCEIDAQLTCSRLHASYTSMCIGLGQQKKKKSTRTALRCTSGMYVTKAPPPPSTQLAPVTSNHHAQTLNHPTLFSSSFPSSFLFLFGFLFCLVIFDSLLQDRSQTQELIVWLAAICRHCTLNSLFFCLSLFLSSLLLPNSSESRILTTTTTKWRGRRKRT